MPDELLRQNGIVVPQYRKEDDTGNEKVTGKNGALNVNINGSLPNQTLEEQLTETDAVAGVLTFSANIVGIGIYNTDAVNAGVFNVNGVDVHVPKSEYVEFVIGGTPSVTVTVTGATTYIVSRLA